MEFKRIDINSEVLTSRFGYDIDNSKAKDYLMKHILNISDPILIIFDFRKLNFDHYFAEVFGPVYKKALNQDENFDIIFQLHDKQIEWLFVGLIDHLNIKYSENSDGDIRKFFLEKNLNIKLMKGNKENKISFYSKMLPEHIKILNYLNKKLDISFDDLYKKNFTSVDRLYQSLEELTKKKFIYKHSDNQYHSIYKYISL